MATQTATRATSSRSGGPIGAVSDATGTDDAKPATRSSSKKGGKKDKDAKGGKKKKLIIIALVLIIGVVAYMMLGKKSATKADAPPKPGAVIAMTDVTLNLTDGHFLKVKLGLQTVLGAPADLDTSKATDLLITEFTGQTMAVVSTADGRQKLRADLLTKIEAAYPKEIMGLYFTEFVMQ